jgi:hypothetical protein
MVVKDNPGDVAANGEDDFPEALLGDFDVSQLPESREEEEGEKDAGSV